MIWTWCVCSLLLLVTCERGPALTRIPTAHDLDSKTYKAFWDGITVLKMGTQVPLDTLVSFDVSEAYQHVKTNNSGVPVGLQGVWWWKQHPSLGQALFTFYSGQGKTFSGNEGEDKGNYLYMSVVKPGAIVSPDTPSNRSGYSYFISYSLEMAFPQFNSTQPLPGTGTYVNTHMSFPYGDYPLPASIAEGWNLEAALEWELEHSTDAARCFCSVYMGKEDVVIRHNFGKYAYSGYRVVRGDGGMTPYWNEFVGVMKDAGIEKMIGQL